MKKTEQLIMPPLMRLVPKILFASLIFYAWILHRNYLLTETLSSTILFAMLMDFVIAVAMTIYFNQKIEFDPVQRVFVRSFDIFGFKIFKFQYSLMQFDRISLHRFGNGTIRATIIGVKEIPLCISMGLEPARESANKFASVTGLPIKDLL